LTLLLFFFTDTTTTDIYTLSLHDALPIFHARRIKIDAPDGGKIDVTAELPPHFAESLAMLGFSPLAGDSLPLEQPKASPAAKERSEEHTSELQSLAYLVCRLLLEKKKEK